MLGKDLIFEIFNEILKDSAAEATSVCLSGGNYHISRFANKTIHQDIAQQDRNIYIKVILDNRIGVAVTNSLKLSELKITLAKACSIAKSNPRERIRLSLPKAAVKEQAPNSYFAHSADLAHADKIALLKKIFERAEQIKVDIAGSFLTGEHEFCVVNSMGIAQYQPSSVCMLKEIAYVNASSGYASQFGPDISKFNIDSVTETAISKCIASRKIRELKVDKIDCILEPEAVGDLIEWLGFIGFGAKQFNERTSFMYGNIGTRIMSDKVTIYDNGLETHGQIIPFDYEGVNKQKIMLINSGVAENVVYDTHYGNLYHHLSTGHAGAPDSSAGPYTSNLVMMPGDKTIEQMKSDAKNALLITRLHYINGLMDTKRAVMTGLTRDGTFLIKNGKIKCAVKNLRFMQSMLEAFSNIAAISKEQKLIGEPSEGLGSVLCPAVLMHDFAFAR